VAWDLVLHRQLPGSCARGDSPSTPGLGILPPALAASTLLLPMALRQVEVGRYRRSHRTDAHDRVLHATQELPAITMSELVYGSGDDR
jgi:hypothetical protein